jgi:hypothetical protein
MVEQLMDYPSTYRDFWNGFNDSRFILLSPFLARQELLEEWRTVFKSEVYKILPYEATIPNIDMVGINPYLLQFSLGNFDAELKRLSQEKRDSEEAERLRLQEMLSQYDGTYQIHLGLNRDVKNTQVYQSLGSIISTLNDGQVKLDRNNILYNALSLKEINFSLYSNGFMTVSGLISEDMNSDKICVHLVGDIKAKQKFIPTVGPNCGITGQNFSMKFEKISDSADFDWASQSQAKNLDGNYDVQWFIKSLNFDEKTLRAKDVLTLSNGIGVFSGKEPGKQPSSELREKLLVQYNTIGEIIILGYIDLIDKKDVKPWYAAGEISPTRKITIKTVWGLGDEIELQIEKY